MRARSTPAWRKSASTAASEPASAAVCELAARAPAPRCAGLQREDRLAARDSARDARERARVAERLQVEQHEVGAAVVLPPLEQVVRGDVGLVADRDERREAEPALGRLLEQREAERAALRGEADAARRERARREGGVQADGRRRRCRGSSGRRAARRARGRARAGAPDARAPSRADLGEAGRDHAQRAHAAAGAQLSAASSTCAARQADDGEVDRRPGSRRSSGTPRTPATGSPRSVDRVGGAGEVGRRGCCGRARRRSSRGGATRRSRRRDAARRTAASDADDGDVVARLDARREARGRRDREAQLDLAAARARARARTPRRRRLEQRRGSRPSPRRRSSSMPASRARERRAARADVCRCRAAARSSATANATSAPRRIAQPRVARERDDRSSPPSTSQPMSAPRSTPVRIEELLDQVTVDCGGRRGSAGSGCRRRARAKKSTQRVRVGRRRGPQPKSAAVPEDDVDRFGCGCSARLDADRQLLVPTSSSCPTGTAVSTTLSACVSAAAPNTS